MDHNKILSTLFLICCHLTSSGGEVGDILVNSGERASLVCPRVSGAQCAWLRDGYSLDMGGRYTREASCQLVIDPVLPLDQGHYQCRAGDWTQEVGSLKVNTAPSRPRIEAGARLMVGPGDLVELQCESGGGRPAGEIQWWDEDTGERIAGEVSTEVKRTGQSFMTTSSLRLRPKLAMSVKCSVHSQTFPAMKYSDRVRIKLMGEPVTVSVSVGDSVSLDCEEDKVTWSINDMDLATERDRLLEVENFVEAYDGAIFQCKVNGKVVKRFKLKKKLSKNGEEKKNNDHEANMKRVVGNPNKYTIFSCDTEEILGRKKIPDTVTIDMNDLDSLQNTATDIKGRKYMCKKFLRSKRVSNLRKTLKSVSHKVGKFSTKFENMT